MPCFFVGIGALFPRIALVLMWLTGYTATGFTTVLWPLLGFFLMPFTTCAYAIGMKETGGFQGWTLVVLIVAILLDFGTFGGGARYRRTVVVRR